MLLLGGILSGCAGSVDTPPGEEIDPTAEDSAGEAGADAPEAVGSATQALGDLFILHPGQCRHDVTTWGWGGTTTVAIRNLGASNGALTIQAQTPWYSAPETIPVWAYGTATVYRSWWGYWITLTNTGSTDLEISVY